MEKDNMALQPHVVATIEKMRAIAHRSLELQREAADAIILYQKYGISAISAEEIAERFPGLTPEIMTYFMAIVTSTITNASVPVNPSDVTSTGVHIFVQMRGT